MPVFIPREEQTCLFLITVATVWERNVASATRRCGESHTTIRRAPHDDAASATRRYGERHGIYVKDYPATIWDSPEDCLSLQRRKDRDNQPAMDKGLKANHQILWK